MDAEQAIAEIEWLEHIFALPDTRPLQLSDLSAANRRHDDMYAHSPCFRLWKRYGVGPARENPPDGTERRNPDYVNNQDPPEQRLWLSRLLPGWSSMEQTIVSAIV